ncbi:MAG: hypothetical protein ACUVT5_07675 [Candidatus Bathyarchaeales archaeon]
MGALRDFIEFIKEAFWITKVCFTSFWFWLPVLFATYIIFQMYLAVAVHPVTLLILPAALIIYMIIWEDKRIAAQYGLKKKGTQPQTQGAIVWNVDKSVDEYLQIVNKRQMSLSDLPKLEPIRPEENEGTKE